GCLGLLGPRSLPRALLRRTLGNLGPLFLFPGLTRLRRFLLGQTTLFGILGLQFSALACLGLLLCLLLAPFLDAAAFVLLCLLGLVRFLGVLDLLCFSRLARLVRLAGVFDLLGFRDALGLLGFLGILSLLGVRRLPRLFGALGLLGGLAIRRFLGLFGLERVLSLLDLGFTPGRLCPARFGQSALLVRLDAIRRLGGLCARWRCRGDRRHR